MAASLQLIDQAGNEISLDAANPLDFGTVGSGSTSSPVQLKIKNTGDEDVFFIAVRSIQHPTAQVGSEQSTWAATEFSSTQDGNYTSALDLGNLAPDQEATFYARWVVPADAPAGDVVWAVEAAGAET